MSNKSTNFEFISKFMKTLLDSKTAKHRSEVHLDIPSQHPNTLVNVKAAIHAYPCSSHFFETSSSSIGSTCQDWQHLLHQLGKAPTSKGLQYHEHFCFKSLSKWIT
jgi:hypothetical protein